MNLGKWLGHFHVVVALDQGISSLSNYIAFSMVARSLDAALFGVFSALYLLSTAWLSVARGWLSSRVSTLTDHDEVRDQGGHILGFTVMLAPIVVASFLLLGAWVHAPTWMSAGTSIFTILLVLQDEMRFASVAMLRPSRALSSDVAWMAIVTLFWFISDGPVSAMIGLSLGPLIGILALVWRFPLRPSLHGAWRFGLTPSAAASAQLLVASWAVGSSLITTLLLVLAYDPSEAAGLQGASAVLTPPLLLVSFTYIGVTPWLSRKSRSLDAPVFVALLVLGGFAVMAWWGVTIVSPLIGETLVGDSWFAAQAFLAAVVLQRLAAVMAASSNVVLRVRGRNATIAAQVAVAFVVFGVSSTLVLVLHQPATWLAWALGGAWMVFAILGATSALRALRSHHLEVEPVS